jgi:hypothetical protein
MERDLIEAAIRGYQEQLRLIDVKVAQISRQMAGKSVAAGVETRKRKHKISAAGRKRISEAQKRRWAKKNA